jgi:hypothetical protein
MKTQIATTETMQADHRAWLAAHAQWRREIERWQAEHKAAVAKLAALQTAIREHGEALEAHARSIREAEESFAGHEREIAAFRAGTSKVPQDVMANRHQEQAGVFSRQEVAHERIKHHHEAVMDQLRALESSAAAAM